MVALVFLLAYWRSPTIFMKPLLFGWSSAAIFKFTLFSSLYFVHIPITLWNIIRTCPNKQPWHRGLGLWGVVRPLIPAGLLIFSSYIWAYYSPSNLLEKNTRTFLFCCGTIASNVTCRLIVAQLCHVPAPLHNKEVYLYSIITVVMCFILPINKDTSIECIVLHLITSFVTLDHLYYAYQVVSTFYFHI
uniref:Ethanolaminephosphotransferase 1 n=1 Tax=Schistosoma haematobium TaxID=6185 RepID=A0A094ZMS8_SCHHA